MQHGDRNLSSVIRFYDSRYSLTLFMQDNYDNSSCACIIWLRRIPHSVHHMMSMRWHFEKYWWKQERRSVSPSNMHQHKKVHLGKTSCGEQLFWERGFKEQRRWKDGEDNSEDNKLKKNDEKHRTLAGIPQNWLNAILIFFFLERREGLGFFRQICVWGVREGERREHLLRIWLRGQLEVAISHPT